MLLGQENIVALGDTQTDRHWQHLSGVVPTFNHEFFNDAWLQETNAVVGLASAGRGSTQFLSLSGQELVLRHYKRGGYASKVSEDRYVWAGLAAARPFHELTILTHLYALNLPVPKPYAAEVIRNGASYSGSLLTYRLPGSTLAEAFVNDTMTPDLWHQVGTTIALFHRHGVGHADLNAHNVIVLTDQESVDESSVSLIDFDRAALKDPEQSEWQHKTVLRLQRSLLKIADKNQLTLLEIAWQTLMDGVHSTARV